MFELLTMDDKQTVFKGLKALIESPRGAYEFYNGDKSHPFHFLPGRMYDGRDMQATPRDRRIQRSSECYPNYLSRLTMPEMRVLGGGRILAHGRTSVIFAVKATSETSPPQEQMLAIETAWHPA